MKLVHIRYKDGRDKLIEMDTDFVLSLPYILSNSVPRIQSNLGGTGSVTTYETAYELVPTAPIQVIVGTGGVRHYLVIEEILDITVEDIK